MLVLELMVKLVVRSLVDVVELVAVVVTEPFGTTGPPSWLVQLGPRALSPDPLVELVMLALVAAVELITIFVMELLVKFVALVPKMLVRVPVLDEVTVVLMTFSVALVAATILIFSFFMAVESQIRSRTRYA